MVPNSVKISFCIALAFSVNAKLFAQFPAKYFVKFTDKSGSSYSVSNPAAFLSAKAINRRTSHGITIDETDLPVNQTYINQVNATGAQVFQRSKWLNGVIVTVSSPTQLTSINNLSFVANSNPINKPLKSITNDVLTNEISNLQATAQKVTGYNYGPSITQITQIGIDCMHERGFRGNNILIGVIDSGFDQVNINPVFDSLRNENRIIFTRDIVAGNSSVYEDHNHGAMVLSCISGNAPGNLIGTAPKSQVILLRSEDVFSEKRIEEYNWVVAAEVADSAGADILTTSLGYTTFDISSQNYTYANLNGKTSPMSIASTMASRKGLFVLNAAGNEGGGSWNYIAVPADADSIFTVGAVNAGGIRAGFSSVGPTADGRIKPDVATMGQQTYVCGPGYNFFAGNGTSFACPIMAGAVACLWQAHPTKTNFEIMQAIKQTASQANNPNNQIGWGIPNICAAHNLLLTPTAIKESQNQDLIKIFPNPTTGLITVDANESLKNIVITDVLGKIQPINFNIANNKAQLNMINLPSGVYFLQIKTNNDSYFSQKIIKE